ncbi:MAG TPA: phytanoyl-CoA dioxygenase family protein [Rhizomicrobium sp.]|jgi:ectoine hydroxylase-related dioxygenase (phytanoyl-CoA dioxygenase family)|nr:phytanoyl-CoA dioxygenase family protein [Rhizomicrobium sp.]
MSNPFKMTDAERRSWDENGYVVRNDVFTRAECEQMGRDVEDLERDLIAAKRNTKITVGSYMFEMQKERDLVVKWEPDFPDVVQGIEPFAHISKPLDTWARDKRLWGAAQDMIGQDNIGLFTEKTTMKRARTGGHIILHQDYPYWRNSNKVAHRVVTAMVQLDDADRNNGCLEVLPGTHRDGWNRVTKKVDGFGANELDTDQFDLNELVPVESPAGSVIFFGPFLIHRSLPNRSNRDRKALLYSYHPGGWPSSVELHRDWIRKGAEREVEKVG